MNALKTSAVRSKFWVQVRQAAILVNGGAALFAAVNLYRGNEKFYQEIAMPLANLWPPETAHRLGIQLAKHKIVPRRHYIDSPSLKTVVWGRSFPSPVGLAAGYDKDAEAVDGLFRMGFGFIEVGTVTPEQQGDNPNHREFLLVEDGALISRYGQASDGHNKVYTRLKRRHMKEDVIEYHHTYLGEQRNMMNMNFWSETESEPSARRSWSSRHVLNSRRHFRRKEIGIVGVNIGSSNMSANPTDDYIKGVRKFGYIADYLVINISGSNTLGQTCTQWRDELMVMLQKVLEERDRLTINPKPAVLVKVSPDLGEKDKQDIADMIMRPQSHVDGIIVCNTTASRPGSLSSGAKSQYGGLSGEPLRQKSLKIIRDMYTLTKGEIPIIGVGGISCGQDAYNKVKAGASLVQVYTALVYQGPPVVDKIKRELAELLRHDGYSSISQAVGVDVKEQSKSVTSH